MNKIEDIKRLRLETGCNFGLEFCKSTYEACGCNVEAAKAKLLSMVDTSISTLTPQEAEELERYKVKAEKRANRKTKPMSAKKKYSLIAGIFATAFLFAFMALLITVIIEEAPLRFEIGMTIATAVISLVLFVISFTVLKLNDREFAEATSPQTGNVVYLHYDNEAIVCPHCGSHDILLKDKKFSKSKAFLGMTAFGVKGVVFGIPSHKRAKCCCGHCGHKFEVVRR